MTRRASQLAYEGLANVFYYLELKDLRSCLLVCKHWNGYLENENGEIWRILFDSLVPDSARNEPALWNNLHSFKSKLRAYYHSWNPSECSRNVYIKLNGFTLHRNPIAQSTDGARAKRGFKGGRHAWEVWWDGPLGTVAVVGVATQHAALQCYGYLPLLGSDDQGWAWNLVDNTLLHNGQSMKSYPAMNNPPRYQVGDRITVILDCDAHMLYFERGFEFMGVAFEDLPPIKLYPCVSAVYGNTEVSMIYLGSPVDG